jgi:hypothetical protein
MGNGGIVPPFLTSAQDGGEWSASRGCRIALGTDCIGGWVGARTGLDAAEEIVPGIEPGLSSPLLYRLRFASPRIQFVLPMDSV